MFLTHLLNSFIIMILASVFVTLIFAGKASPVPAESTCKRLFSKMLGTDVACHVATTSTGSSALVPRAVEMAAFRFDLQTAE